ncbi:hypothetical protein [Paenibacillus sp. CGMCC 1.18879]|uniref:hypothetical protein n=1 Tax=Paenibacillus sp. CGMCC 1.18879 TaxID=2834466 RepID=UPI001CA8ACB0|nr:hypothetical protein [Paenibacillus sp. CGMCC 1.18879]
MAYLHLMVSLGASVYVLFSALNTGLFRQAFLQVGIIWAFWLLAIPIHKMAADMDR